MKRNGLHRPTGRRRGGLSPLALFPLIACMTGCASSGYLIDRGRDAADVLSLSVGAGIGAKARIGPIGTGLLLDSPVAGLRGGDWLTGRNFANPGKPVAVNNDLQLLIVGQETFLGSALVQQRGKLFYAGMIGAVNIPSMGDLPNKAQTVNRMLRRAPPRTIRHSPGHYLSQIELVAGLGISLRIGFNPAEFLDLILGFAGIDMFEDDIEVEMDALPSPAPDGRAEPS